MEIHRIKRDKGYSNNNELDLERVAKARPDLEDERGYDRVKCGSIGWIPTPTETEARSGSS